MATRTRILTINDGEEAIIRMNTTKHVTLEFSRSIVTLFEEGGVVYMRQQFQEGNGDVEEEEEEVEAGSDEPTQFMETQIEFEDETQTQTFTQMEFTPEAKINPEIICINSDVNITFRKPLTRSQCEDIESLQRDLFGDLN